MNDYLMSEDDGSSYTTASSGDYSYEFSDEACRKWSNENGNERNGSKMFPVKNTATFSWSHINAFSIKPAALDMKEKVLSKFRCEEKKPDTNHILKNMNGTAYPGELMVIMGSSGAGKTTLLNCMTFRNLKSLIVSGIISINNKTVDQTQLAAQSAYVQQDDLLLGYLTVREHLIFQALVRINSKFTYEEKLNRVEEVMMELSLKKCENCLIGVKGIVKGISGGERKRLALASEFLMNPTLLFCDEPTSGLDSFMALNVMRMLKYIAKSGRTVITTLHQPSSEAFLLIDKLCLVAEGRTAFLGTLSEAESFFDRHYGPCPKNFNPADFYIQVLSSIPGNEKACSNTIQSICDAFDASIEKKTENQVVPQQDLWSPIQSNVKPYKVGWYIQLSAVMWRSWLAFVKNPIVTKERSKTVLAEAILITLIYFGQRVNQQGITNLDGVIFHFLMSTAYGDLFGAINMFCAEIPMFLKEHKDGLYRTDVYFLSKSICAIPICILMASLKVGIVYFAVGLNPEFDRFLTALCITIMVGIAAQGLGFLVSTLAPSKEIAPSITTYFMVPSIITGGIYLNYKSIPPILRWLGDLSFIRFGHEAYMVNQWSDISSIPCSPSANASGICIYDGPCVLHLSSITVHDFWPAIGGLFLLLIGFRICAFLILLYKANLRD